MTQKKAIQPEYFPFFDYRRYSYSMAVVKGDYLFFSGNTAGQYDHNLKKMVCHGDVIDQAGVAYEKIKLLVESAGGSCDNIINVTEYVAPAGLDKYKSIADVRRQYFKNNLPAVTTVVVHHLLRPDALIEVQAVAVLGKSKVEVFNPGWTIYEKLACNPAVKKGDLLFISAQPGTDHSKGEIVAKDDIVAQTEQVYKNIDEVLKLSGATFNDIVKTTDYITSDGLAYYQDTQKIRAKYFKDACTTATEVLVNQITTQGAMIEVDCIAITGNAKKETFNLDLSHYQKPNFSLIVKKDQLVFISGINSVDMVTTEMSGSSDVVAQTRQIFVNIEKLLNAAGISWKDIVKTIDFIVPKAEANYRATANIRREYFKEIPPASTGVIVNQLLKKESLIEIDLIAVAD